MLLIRTLYSPASWYQGTLFFRWTSMIKQKILFWPIFIKLPTPFKSYDCLFGYGGSLNLWVPKKSHKIICLSIKEITQDHMFEYKRNHVSREGLSDVVSGWLVTYPALPCPGTLIHPSPTLGEWITISSVQIGICANTQIQEKYLNKSRFPPHCLRLYRCR